MPITRTAMIDDDGSGTTGTIINNAWKQEFYNQIDALGAVNAVYGAWTPLDASGATLTFSPASALYAKIDRLVFVWCNFAFPTTSHAAPASIAGLPFANSGVLPAGLYPTYGVSRVYYIPANTTGFLIMNPTTGAQMTNAQLSGASITASGFYRVS